MFDNVEKKINTIANVYFWLLSTVTFITFIGTVAEEGDIATAIGGFVLVAVAIFCFYLTSLLLVALAKLVEYARSIKESQKTIINYYSLSQEELLKDIKKELTKETEAEAK